jgi:hypothetical protein
MARPKAIQSGPNAASRDKTPLPDGLSKPALRALDGAGYHHLEDLAEVPQAALQCLHGVGPNAIKTLGQALKANGLSFAAPKTSGGAPADFADLWCDDRARQGRAFQHVLELTSQPVDWAYDVWEEVLGQLADRNNRNRSIAAQVLCNLAKSDPARRILRDFPALFEVVKDERFVTARHALQAMWKVGCVGPEHRGLLLAALEGRFSECTSHKNCTLIRYDIIECLRKLFEATHDDSIGSRARALIELEDDPKYKKKYLSVWPKR